MTYPINYKDINSSIDFYSELNAIHEEAKNYLLSFNWCKEIKDCNLYTNLGEVFCIFLFEIVNKQSIEDDFLWIVVGDIPAMYLDIHGPKTTKEVVEDYVRLAEDWINHVKNGKSVNACYPFKAEPNIEMAELLKNKISFIKNTLLNNIEDIKYQSSK